MAHNNTVFSQILQLIDRHDFERLAQQHHNGKALKKMTRWSQLVAMMLGQLGGRSSLRDIESNLAVQSNKLYHLGCNKVSRSSLARVNEKQPYTLYEALFGQLLSQCQSVAPRHKFRFKNKLISLDSTTIDLCLSLYDWANFRATKGAVKLHVGLDHDGLIPSVVSITDGKVHDMTAAKTMALPKGSIVIVDRAYTDYDWFNTLNSKEVFFVIRQKKNAVYTVIDCRNVDQKTGVTSDQTIQLMGGTASALKKPLRRVGYCDPETGKHFVFITNHLKLSAKTIADIYKARWQVELFFKEIKQGLKIKSFVGQSKNAVLTQIWIALCSYLLMAWIKFSNAINTSVGGLIKLLHMNLFDRRQLTPLLKGDPPDARLTVPENQMALV